MGYPEVKQNSNTKSAYMLGLPQETERTSNYSAMGLTSQTKGGGLNSSELDQGKDLSQIYYKDSKHELDPNLTRNNLHEDLE